MFSRLCVVILISILTVGYGNKCPRIGVIHIHGLFEGWREHVRFRELIGQKYGVYVHLIGSFSYVESLTPLWQQVDSLRKEVTDIASRYDKIIGIGFSQGGLLWRGIVETWDDHNIDTLITLASPLAGVRDLPDLIFKNLPLIKGISRSLMWMYAYTSLGQTAGILNFFKDPKHHDLYLRKCSYLPDVNCERGSLSTKIRYKKNFLKLRKMLVVGGPGEDVVHPWQSTVFGYYKPGTENTILDMTQTYQNDLFGLRTLAERNGLQRCVFNGLDHIDFRDDEKMLEKCVFPVLNEIFIH